MTQATHTPTLCTPQPRTKVSERFATALKQLRISLPAPDSEPENTAGFSAKYRSEIAERESQQRNLTVFTGFVGSFVR